MKTERGSYPSSQPAAPAATLQAGPRRVLELMAQDAPLAEVLTTLMKAIEAQSQHGLLGSILLLDPDGVHLHCGAAPSLPAAYNQAIEGLAIGPSVGSCGTAAFRKKPVHVSDIANDPLWQDFRELALAHGLRACWSIPIFSSTGEVLGTFALYYREARQPPAADLAVVDMVTHMAAIAIERKRTEAALRTSEQHFRLLFEQAVDGIFVTDAQGRFTDVNAAGCAMLGYTRDEILALSLADVVAPEEAPRLPEAVAAFAGGAVVTSEWRLRRKDDSFLIGELVGRQLPDGRLQAFVRDITQRTAVAVAQRESEQRLRHLAAELSEADRRKNEFLAMLAHELRNPLAPIRNAAHMLRLTGGELPAVQSASGMIERQVGQLVRLVDDLLDVSRISRGKIELRRERITLQAIVTSAVEAIEPLCSSLEHALEVQLPDQPIWLDADPTRLAQVVGNLLNNACKFSHPRGQVSLIVERADAGVQIRVRDRGIGLAPDQVPRIFEMFVQLDTSLERSVSGLGIGLTLVKELTEMHGGRIEVHSAGPGHGSEFVVHLPLAPAQALVQHGPDGSPTAPASAHRILVVDDNRDAAASLAELLRMEDHEVHTAHDGNEAVQQAARLRPDVMLLDIGLPGLNGYEVARAIRGQEWGRNLLLVALTGWGQEQDRLRSREVGFDAHLVKPVDYAALLALLAGPRPRA